MSFRLTPAPTERTNSANTERERELRKDRKESARWQKREAKRIATATPLSRQLKFASKKSCGGSLFPISWSQFSSYRFPEKLFVKRKDVATSARRPIFDTTARSNDILCQLCPCFQYWWSRPKKLKNGLAWRSNLRVLFCQVWSNYLKRGDRDGLVNAATERQKPTPRHRSEPVSASCIASP